MPKRRRSQRARRGVSARAWLRKLLILTAPATVLLVLLTYWLGGGRPDRDANSSTGRLRQEYTGPSRTRRPPIADLSPVTSPDEYQVFAHPNMFLLADQGVERYREYIETIIDAARATEKTLSHMNVRSAVSLVGSSVFSRIGCPAPDIDVSVNVVFELSPHLYASVPPDPLSAELLVQFVSPFLAVLDQYGVLTIRNVAPTPRSDQPIEEACLHWTYAEFRDGYKATPTGRKDFLSCAKRGVITCSFFITDELGPKLVDVQFVAVVRRRGSNWRSSGSDFQRSWFGRICFDVRSATHYRKLEARFRNYSDLVQSEIKNIETLCANQKFLKACKRLVGLCANEGDAEGVSRIGRLLSSDVSHAYMLGRRLKTLTFWYALPEGGLSAPGRIGATRILDRCVQLRLQGNPELEYRIQQLVADTGEATMKPPVVADLNGLADSLIRYADLGANAFLKKHDDLLNRWQIELR